MASLGFASLRARTGCRKACTLSGLAGLRRGKTAGHPHSPPSPRYRCTLPGLTGFTGLRTRAGPCDHASAQAHALGRRYRSRRQMGMDGGGAVRPPASETETARGAGGETAREADGDGGSRWDGPSEEPASPGALAPPLAGATANPSRRAARVASSIRRDTLRAYRMRGLFAKRGVQDAALGAAHEEDGKRGHGGTPGSEPCGPGCLRLDTGAP